MPRVMVIEPFVRDRVKQECQSGQKALLRSIDDDVLRPRHLGERNPRPRRAGGSRPTRVRAEVGQAPNNPQGCGDGVQSDPRGQALISRRWEVRAALDVRPESLANVRAWRCAAKARNTCGGGFFDAVLAAASKIL